MRAITIWKRRRNVTLIAPRETHREFSYRVNKAAYGPAIAAVWGWHEERQLAYHARDWEECPPRIISFEGKPVGTVCIRGDKGYLSLSQFCILPEYQRRGIGSCVLEMLLDEADRAGLVVRLACLPDNPARFLYLRHGFRQTGADAAFLYLEREPVPITARGRW